MSRNTKKRYMPGSKREDPAMQLNTGFAKTWRRGIETGGDRGGREEEREREEDEREEEREREREKRGRRRERKESKRQNMPVPGIRTILNTSSSSSRRRRRRLAQGKSLIDNYPSDSTS